MARLNKTIELQGETLKVPTATPILGTAVVTAPRYACILALI